MNSVTESTLEKKPALVLGGMGITGRHAREANVVGEAGSQRATVNVELGEWFVNAGSTSIPADYITFDVSNRGGQPHEFIVIQTNLAPDALPVK